MLGVSVQALERWVRSGALPVVRKPGSSRELIDAEALLVVAEEVGRLREEGVERGVLADALRTLRAEGRLPRKLRPNQSAAELRHEYLHTLRPSGCGRQPNSASLPALSPGTRRAANRDRRHHLASSTLRRLSLNTTSPSF